MEPMDQAVRKHRSDQRSAAADVEVGVELVLQAADRVAVVRPDDLRVLHVAFVSVAEKNVPGRVAEERCSWIVLHGWRRPGRLEHLVGLAPEQDASGTARGTRRWSLPSGGQSRNQTSTSARRLPVEGDE